jgi:hypothetical protein
MAESVQSLLFLSDDAIALVLGHLPVPDLGRVARLNKRLRDISMDRTIWIQHCLDAGIEVPDDTVDVRQYYRRYSSLRWDPLKAHSYVQFEDNDRAAYAVYTDPSYFAGVVSKPELPKHGKFRVTYTADNTHTTPLELGVGLVNSAYNVADPEAGTANSSQGFWEENDGVGYYTSGGGFAYSAGFPLSFELPAPDVQISFGFEVDREAGTVTFLQQGVVIGSYQNARVCTQEMFLMVLLLRPQLRVHLGRVETILL